MASGAWTRPLNQRVATGASEAGSPSGNQIQEDPSRSTGAVRAAGAAIHWARHSSPSSPVSHQVGADQGEGRPRSSQTRTDQW